MTSLIEEQATASQTGRSILSHTLLKRSLSSASSIEARSQPINSTLSSSNDPSFAKADAMFNAVCPPIPARSASGFSISRILFTTSGSRGSMYILSAISGSFWMVAGLELINITSYPSSLNALHAWDPEKSNSAACPILIGPLPSITIRDRSFLRGTNSHLLQ